MDGGSFDGTPDIARRFRNVRVIQLPKKSGKGEAVRAGIEAAVGNVIVTFPGDGEYSANDIYPIVEAIVKNRYPVVFGSRATKMRKPGPTHSEDLRSIALLVVR